MPTITIDRKSFEKYVGKKLTDEKLKDRISFLGTDLESIDANEINVEIFPNRPDLLSVQGFARAFSSFIGEKPGLRDYVVKDSGESVIIDKSVQKVRPFTACAIVKGLRFDDETIKEVIQIQEKLHVTYGRNRKKAAIGVYPMEKIKFPIRFMAKKPEEIKFQPLEFPRLLTGAQILSQHPTGREYGHLLEGQSVYPFFIDAADNILSMPPIINSHLTGKITGATTDVFIECSGFDFDVLQKCLNMIVTALADIGGKIFSMRLKYPDKIVTTPNLAPTKTALDLNYVNKRLGLELTQKDVKMCLEKMGFGYSDNKVLVPAYRADILHQIDFVEDIAIAYGFENFDSLIPNAATIGSQDPFEVFKNKLASLLVGLGLLETNTYNLTNRDFQTALMESTIDVVHLANSLSAEYDVLRAWMTPSLLEVLKNNKHNDYPQKIFGIGTVFKKDQTAETGVLENDNLACALCSDSSDFTGIRQAVDYLFASIGCVCKIEPVENSSFISGRAGNILVAGKVIGMLGELHPKVLRNWSLDLPVSAFEINLTDLFALIKK